MLSRRIFGGLLRPKFIQQPKIFELLRRFNSNTTQKSNNTAQEKVNKFIHNVKAGTRFLLSSWLIIIAGGATMVTMYLIATELFSPSGETATYNRVVSMVESDETSLKLLGYTDDDIKQGGIRLKAYSDANADRWTRNRTVQGTKYTGTDGADHLFLRFFVESNYKGGVIQVEAIEKNYIEQEIVYVSLDVPGQPRHYIVGGSLMQRGKRALGMHDKNGFLGVKWGPKKE
ncbi:Tim21 protein [Martiniozyma asiatica (nom. inval.)]|nr:Tim21 protein [Martiniozyma asiatica]